MSVDWARVPTYLVSARMMPDALRALAEASDRQEAVRRGDWIERAILAAEGPSEGCLPVAKALVAALPRMTPPGHGVALELLCRIAAAEIVGPPHEQLGVVDAGELRRAVAGGFEHYVAMLRSPDARTCVGLLDVLARHDHGLRARAVAALQAVRTAELGDLIDSTIRDLTESD